MSFDVLDMTLMRLVDEDLLGGRLSISWHGAEPLAAGLGWYQDAFARIATALTGQTQVSHIFQTNGVLLSDDWCNFFRATGSTIGLSIDGPVDQSASRVNWSGKPAFPAAMRGIGYLQRHGIPWTMLAVIGRPAMENADDFVQFVKSTGCSGLGFKVEETNIDNRSVLHDQSDIVQLYANFIAVLWGAFPENATPVVREFEDYRAQRRRARQSVPVTLVPLRNLTVRANGDYTVFSGELLFRDDDEFVFGNVLKGKLLDSLLTDRFRKISSDIFAGAKKCAESCEYYAECGSFYISQKHAEAGTFNTAETLACLLETKTLFNTLDELAIFDGNEVGEASLIQNGLFVH